MKQRLDQKAELHDFNITDEDYWSVREELIKVGGLQKGSGRGGSVFRFDSSWRPENHQSATEGDGNWDDLDEPSLIGDYA